MAHAVVAVALKVGAKLFAASLVKKIALNVAISVGLSVLRKLTSPKAKTRTGARLLNAEDVNNLTANSISDRQGVYGQTGVAGEIIFAHLHADRRWVSYVVQLADAGQNLPHELVSMTIDGAEVTFVDGDANGAYAGVMKLRFYGGTHDQAADATLMTDSANRWSSDHRGRGICYVVWSMELANEEKFPNGRPDPIFVVKGRRLYDPRKDSTKPGGDGDHRAEDDSTWEWSNNAALVIYDFLRGVTMGDPARRVAGLGLADRLIDEDWVVASANVCDDEGWTIDGPFTFAGDPVETLTSFAEHMGGRIATVRGKLAPIAGANWPDVLEIGSSDLAGPLQIESNREWREAVNAVRGSYRDPAQRWELIETYGVEVAEWVEEDRGEVFELPITFPFKYNYDAVTKAMRVALYRARAPRTITGPFKLRCAPAQEGAMVAVNIPEYGINERYEVDTRGLDATGFVTLSLRLYDPEEALDFAGGGAAPTTERIDRPVVTPETPADWEAEGVTVGADGAQMPAIRVVGAVPGYVDSAVIEYRPHDVFGASWAVWGEVPRSLTEITIAGVAPAVVYDVAVRYRRGPTLGGRYVVTALTPATLTSIDTLTVAGVAAADLVAQLETLEGVPEHVGSLFERYLSLSARIDETRHSLARLGFVDGIPLGTTLATMSSERAEGDALIAETLALIGARSDDGLAFIIDTATAKVSPSETLATRLSTLSANDATNAAAITTESTARASGDSAIASSLATLASVVGGHTSTLTTYGAAIGGVEAKYGVKLDVNGRITGIVINAGATTTDFIVVADRFAFVDPGATGGTPSVPFSYSGGVLKMHSVEVDTLKANSVITASINGAAVTRDKLAANATSATASAYTAGSVTSSGGSSFTAQSVSITSVGGTVSVGFSMLLKSTFSNCTVHVEIIRDGSTSLVDFIAVAETGTLTPTGYAVQDTPAAGSHTYTVVVTQNTGTFSEVYASNRALNVLELRN